MYYNRKLVSNIWKDPTLITVLLCYPCIMIMESSFLGHLGTNQCGSPTLSFLAWLEMHGQVLQIYLVPSIPLPRAKTWNRDHFGNLFHRKRRIYARLKGVQTALGNNLNNFLIDLEKSLLVELSSVANLEAEFWSMKSRISWVFEGDRNTTFFHNLALICRRRNHISSMKDSMDNWLNGDHEIVDFIKQGFINLFTTSHCSASRQEWQPPFWRCSLKFEDITKLERPVTDDEILAALQSLKPYKAPGPNGLYAGFFQQFWLIVGNLVKTEVKQTFCFGKVLEYLNRTLITLIPKCNNPESPNNYCPIGKCNTVYKVITKLIIARI